MARKASQTAGLIKVRCPNQACGKILAVKAAMGGKKARCPLCGQTMAIPKMTGPAAKKPSKKKPVPATPPPAPEEQTAPPAPPTPPEEEAVAPKEEPMEEPKEEPQEKKAEAPQPSEQPQRQEKTEEKVPPPDGEVAAAASAQTQEEKKAEEPAPAEETPPPPAEPKPEAAAPELPPSRPGAESVMVGAPSPKGHPTPRTLARVAKEAAETGYELIGGQLRVVGAIGYDLNTGFRDKCDELLASGEKELLLDLSQVLYLSSSHIGVIAGLATGAMAQDRKVKVRVTGKVARVLKFAGIDRLVELENVDE